MRRATWVLGLVAVVVLGAYLGAARRTTGPPLDPRSTTADGTRGLVELVRTLGGSIEVVEGAPGDATGQAVLLEDRLPRAQADELTAWVEAGGQLVVADPTSLFTPAVAGAAVDTLRGSCALGGLTDVEVLDVGVSRFYDVPSGVDACFLDDGSGAFVVVEARGAGTVVSIGGPDLFTNRLLDEADNAVLAAALLVGDRPTAFVRPGLPGGGERGLVDLVDTPVRAALAQLLIAFFVLVAWRSRRLGRPIEEPQLVAIEGSELTRAVGRLLAANRRPDRAAALLRDRARRDLSAPLGLALDATVDEVVAALSARTTMGADDVHRAVAGSVTTDTDLVEVARLLARIRQEMTHEPATARA